MIDNLKNHRILSGYLFAICATAIWSGNFIIARDLNEHIDPISLAFLRWSVAVIVLLPFALRSVIAERNILKKNLPYLCLTSLLGISIFNTMIYYASHTTTAFNLSLIAITFPIFIIIFSRIFFKELISLNKGIGITLVVCGVLLLITRGQLGKLLSISFAIGDLWMLLAAIIFAFYNILLRYKPEHLSIWAFQLTTFTLGLIFLVPFFVWENLTVQSICFDTRIVFSILYLGIFASLSAFILWMTAVIKIGPSKAGMIYYTLPLFSGFSAYIFLGEAITRIHFYSAILIVLGILRANYETKKIKPSA